jgi:hypothetical protein
MKKIFVLSLLVVPMCLLSAMNVSADPRMETNKNFCHFILDATNTDNEVFMAGCDSVITVDEKVAEVGNIQMSSNILCNYVASGYGKVEKVIPLAIAPLPPGNTLVFTSDMSETPCTMVESNGRAYKSYNWKSTIKVQRKNTNYVTVQYELTCQDGHQ